MIKVEDIDYDLSLKLGDPRDDKGDGQQFSRQDRLKYLGRAYGRLLRILEKLTRDYQPLFARMRRHDIIVLEGDERRGWRIVLKNTVRKIDELYIELTVKEEGKKSTILVDYEAESVEETRKTGEDKFGNTIIGKVAQGIFVSEENYISTILGTNELYQPDYDKSKIFYSYFRGGIQLMPQKVNGYSKLHIVYQEDVPVLTMDSAIEISNDYRDLLIVLAAKEGMEDIARNDKVQLYTRDIESQLQILGISVQKAERDEGAKASG